MINLLELTKKQTLILSAATVVLGIAFVVGLGMYVAAQSNTAKQSFGSEPYQANSVTQPVKETQTSDSSKVEAAGDTETVTTYTTPQKAVPQPAAPTPVNKTPMQETPSSSPTGQPDDSRYTNKVVTPGDGASYVGTYGQCPFYENAGVKGCWPPSDIICNDNWSVCSYKGN